MQLPVTMQEGHAGIVRDELEPPCVALVSTTRVRE